MKKWLLGALAFVAASLPLFSQTITNWQTMPNSWVRIDGGVVSPAGILNVQDEGSDLDLTLTKINFVGSAVTCVTDLANSRATCTITGGGSTPTGTGFVHVTGGVQDGASKTVDLASSDITGLLPFANIANGSALSLFGRSANSSGVQASITATAASDCVFRESGSTVGCGTVATAGVANSAVTLAKIANAAASSKWLGSGASGSGAAYTENSFGTGLSVTGTTLNATQDPGLSRASQAILFDDFWNVKATASGGIQCSQMYCYGNGTSAGLAGTLDTPSTTDGNSPGVVEMTTGSTTTGTATIGSGGLAGSSVDSIVLAGNEVVEWRAYVKTASDATNTHRVYFGLCDKADGSTDCQDGLGIYWDNNADTHWGCEASSNAVHTNTLSNTTATAGAWHKFTITVNSNATSIAYQVDGSTLSCSPLTTNIPTGTSRGTGLGARMVASAGCAATTTCEFTADYVYFSKTGITR